MMILDGTSLLSCGSLDEICANLVCLITQSKRNSGSLHHITRNIKWKMLTSASEHSLKHLRGNFFLKSYVINALEIEIFDFFFRIISPFGMLKSVPGALVNKTLK